MANHALITTIAELIAADRGDSHPTIKDLAEACTIARRPPGNPPTPTHVDHCPPSERGALHG